MSARRSLRISRSAPDAPGVRWTTPPISPSSRLTAPRRRPGRAGSVRYDYYPESDLIWLDADTKIRELSGGKKSLDDFAKLFYGMDNGSYVTKTYTFDDLVTALEHGAALRLDGLPAHAGLRGRPTGSGERNHARRLPAGLQRRRTGMDETRRCSSPRHQLRHFTGILGERRRQIFQACGGIVWRLRRASLLTCTWRR